MLKRRAWRLILTSLCITNNTVIHNTVVTAHRTAIAENIIRGWQVHKTLIKGNIIWGCWVHKNFEFIRGADTAQVNG